MDTDVSNNPTSVQNEIVDKVTLELLMNKNHYKRYIAHTDPVKHEENMKHNELIKKYKHRVVNMTNDLLSSPTKQITTDVNEAFTHYIKTLFQYFQMKELEYVSNERSDDEDMLFGNMDNTDDGSEPDVVTDLPTPKNADNNIDALNTPLMKSFWGGKHVVKKK
jgi:hypothetical protein